MMRGRVFGNGAGLLQCHIQPHATAAAATWGGRGRGRGGGDLAAAAAAQYGPPISRGLADGTGAGRGRGRVSLADRLARSPPPQQQQQRRRQEKPRQQQQQRERPAAQQHGAPRSGAETQRQGPASSTPAWAADTGEGGSAALGNIKELMWGQTGSQRSASEPPKPKPMSAEELQRRSQRMAAAVSAAVPTEAKGWSPVAALHLQALAVADGGDATRGAKLTFEEYEAKYANRIVRREPVAPNVQHMGETFDLQLMNMQYTIQGNPRPGQRHKNKKTFQKSRGPIMVGDARAELGFPRFEPPAEQEERIKLIAEAASARQARMPVPLHMTEAFSSTAAAVTAVQKNSSLTLHGEADGMVAELLGRAQAFQETVAELEAIVVGDERRRAELESARPVVEEDEEELAFGELLDFDEDEEEFL